MMIAAMDVLVRYGNGEAGLTGWGIVVAIFIAWMAS